MAATITQAPSASFATPSSTMIAVRLVTRSVRYAIPNAKYMVPSDWKRFQLSELINKVLEHSQPVPFDFVIQNQLLRTTINNFIQAHGLSTENVIEIEYLESVLPPKFLKSFEHDDWVSDLKISENGMFLTASYDSNLRLFSSSNITKPILTISGHQQSILSTCWVPRLKQDSSELGSIASAGMDRVIRIWKLSTTDQDLLASDQNYSYETTHVLALHNSPVSTIEACQNPHHPGRLVSGDWTGTLAFWDLTSSQGDRKLDLEDVETTKASTNEHSHLTKRRKKNEIGRSNQLVVSKEPQQVINAHQSKISGALFSKFDSSKVLTASHDHSVKRFDLETGVEEWSKIAGPEKCLLDIDECQGREGLLVTGCMDRTVCFWDCRETTQNISLVLHGHTGPVSSISSNPSSSNSLQILSGSYDGTCKIWDTRSVKQSLYTIKNPKDDNESLKREDLKVLTVGWNTEGNLLGFGGEDRNLAIHSVN
ncbi:hypothetical protein O181_002146 [Austropuccinia psidii MF-1]|uniref:Ribosome biogenesis protein YTM1 n=1 Tax=Austropuccinia psidii MF-1 TaxID=1389203 RepID=A0A9Q3GD18_9BASI|nr:hypothetical protein [Austropuccinia psidii MF-1]